MIIQIPELYDCVQAPTWVSQHLYVVIFALAVVLVALVFLLYHAYTQYIASRKPYWQVALDNLALIKPPVSSTFADEKRFYEDLTRVLKWYCGNRYGWFLSSKTDKELVAALRELGEADELLVQLEECMRASVQVKFAKDLVSCEQASADKRSVVSFIERTIPIHS